MLDINDLKKGIIFLRKGDPYEVLESDHLTMGRGGAVLQVKIRNLRTRNVLRETFRPSESFREAEIVKKEAVFIYSSKGEYVFSEKNNPSARFVLSESIVGEAGRFLASGAEVALTMFENEVIGVELPIKIELRVKEAPPGVRGDTSSGGKKTVVLETGAEIDTPLFINEGDIVRVNTEKGEYVERVRKG